MDLRHGLSCTSNLSFVRFSPINKLEYYEGMHKFIPFYRNIEHLLTQRLNPFLQIFMFKNDMQEKETTTNNWYGRKFPALG